MSGKFESVKYLNGDSNITTTETHINLNCVHGLTKIEALKELLFFYLIYSGLMNHRH